MESQGRYERQGGIASRRSLQTALWPSAKIGDEERGCRTPPGRHLTGVWAGIKGWGLTPGKATGKKQEIFERC